MDDACSAVYNGQTAGMYPLDGLDGQAAELRNRHS